MTLTFSQQQALVIAPKPSAALSFVSSSYILFSILTSPERRRKVYHRLVVALSFWNLLVSVVFFWGTWAIPAEFPMLGAAGTERTCSAQGFLIQMSFAVPFYYCSLALFAYLAVRNDFDEKVLRRFERWIHVCVFVFPVSTAIWGLQKHYFNPAGPWCWITSYPPGCEKENSPYPCIYGQDIGVFRTINISFLFFFYGFSTFMMAALYVMVWRREKRRDRLLGKTHYKERARRKKSRVVARQAGLYLATFYAIYFFSIISRFIQLSTGQMHFPTIMLGIIFNPLQGFLNMLVYVSLRHKRSGSNDPDPAGARRGMSVLGNTQVSSFLLRVQEKSSIQSLDTAEKTSAPFSGLTNASNKDYEFSIFDGTNPSSQWAEFFDDGDEEEEPPECQERIFGNEDEGYSVQEEGAVSGTEEEEEKPSGLHVGGQIEET